MPLNEAEDAWEPDDRLLNLGTQLANYYWRARHTSTKDLALRQFESWVAAEGYSQAEVNFVKRNWRKHRNAN